MFFYSNGHFPGPARRSTRNSLGFWKKWEPPVGRRGPPPRTDKQLRGNPGHCRLNFPHPVTTPLDPPPIAEIPVPEFLTTGREVELFKTVVSDPAMRPLLRSTDAFALARWCTYQHFW